MYETGLIRISPSASKFRKEDLEALNIVFRPASSEDAVIPAINVKDYPKKYEIPEINSLIRGDPNFNVNNFKKIQDNRVKTFIDKLHDVIRMDVAKGTDESTTDTLVSDMLSHAADMDSWPFIFRRHPFCELVIGGKAVSARPEFVIDKGRIAIVVIEDKHLKNKMLTKGTGFGEVQLAAEILACGSVNLRDVYMGEYVDQEIFAIRVISSYFTFYRTVITASYWEELDLSLPKEQMVMIERWPPKNGKDEGLDIAELGGRKAVLMALAKIREHLLQ
ncbi:14658_t:CDS:2 [Dentiscutata erythropus]|uniref:14658_t:CDS:1 n=1 Tax=Dentiscutata erythropus TaxID=1348616 RepID=A0A9N9BZE6_9GLOM|nr:14658_t:CDS:2 [Dentiscutata erythropus]